jgi:AraC-like DNA-binding protein
VGYLNRPGSPPPTHTNRHRALKLHETELPPTGIWANTTDHWSFVLVARGRAQLANPRSLRSVVVGDVVAFGPASAGQLKALPKEGVWIQRFQFQARDLNGLLSLAERQALDTWPRQSHAKLYQAQSSLAEDFARFVNSPLAVGTLGHRCQLIAIIALFLDDHKLIASASGTQTSAHHIAGVLRGLPESDLRDLSVDELSARCGCSRRHLTRVFGQLFGHSIMTHRMSLRLEQASELLRSSDAKIIDIAFDCGFAQLGQFTAQFRRLYGTTPARWRRDIQANVAAETAALAKLAATGTRKGGAVALGRLGSGKPSPSGPPTPEAVPTGPAKGRTPTDPTEGMV